MNSTECIHSAVFAQAERTPAITAIVSKNPDGSYQEVSYDAMAENALKVAQALSSLDIEKNELVAVVLPKGVNQVYATLGIQSVGGAYVPVGVHQPIDRMRTIFEAAKISAILTDKEHAPLFAGDAWKVLTMEEALMCTTFPREKIVEDPSALAYIIFTSGTTGVPKGVMIAHHAASNTIRDINERFNVGPGDTAIALSQLDFDLSLYDIFGVLSAGGKLAVLSEDTKKEANAWKNIAIEQKVTLWNSVPALFEMFTIVAGDSFAKIPLKTVMLSGDWIPLPLFDTTKKLWPGCRFVSLGGATEVSIWSVYYEVATLDKEWKSIPYGKALLNQKIKVMDESGKECPVGEPGELWIGGVGVAEGYLNQPELTRERFPEEKGERWYRTGDKVCMKADGNTEFLGRLDTQIKLGGYRIELGEIENVIKKNPSIVNAAAVVMENGNKKEIAAAVVPSLKRSTKLEWVTRLVEGCEGASLTERKSAVGALIKAVLAKAKAANDMEGVVQMWHQWLGENPICEIERPSELYQKITATENAEMLQQVLEGKRPATDLLQKDLFAPEKLLSESRDFNKFIKTVAGYVNALNPTEPAKTIHMAFLNARTGLAVQEFLEVTQKENLEITLFDESAGMLATARETLSRCNKQACNFNFRTFSTNGAVENLESFDFVVDAGFLHTYSNPVDPLQFAYLTLKKGGRFLALDFENFDPIAIVSSAVLEKGFSNYTRLRRHTPLLTDEEWESVFQELPFPKVEYFNDSHFAQTIITQKPEEASEILDGDYEKYLKEHLVPYMIPSRTEVFVKFPLTHNAKVDRKAIAAALKKSAPVTDVNENYQGHEKDLADIWKALLSLEHVDRQANFFEIGGDSLLATRFLEKVHTQFGVEITLREIFENAELDKLAKILDEKIEAMGDMEEGEI